MEKSQLVFIPFPVTGHIMATVEFAKLLLNHDHQLSITVLILKLPADIYDPKVGHYIQSVSFNRIQFISLQEEEPETLTFASFVHRHLLQVKQAVSKLTQAGSDSPRLAGFVLDMFTTEMIDVANDFSVPSYVFFASGAANLGFYFHMSSIFDDQRVDPTELMGSAANLSIPCLVNPFPGKAMPQAFLDEEEFPILLHNHRRFKEAKGFIINTFFELESYAIESFSNGKTEKSIAVYPVGPILKPGDDHHGSIKQQEIIKWLDDQPPSSVVFLCFGSEGCFGEDQVKEIAYALERGGHRFLWSLRRPPPTVKGGFPSDYENPNEVLPEGFLDRTAKIGKIIGWAPQAAILAHQAIGGFVSHCGWNSILESIWYGVPIATWPLYAEQQFNAFAMVIELGLAVEIKMDYRVGDRIIIGCDEIERGIRYLMEPNGERRKKVKELSKKSRMALLEDGSSYTSLKRLVKDLNYNMN